MAYKSLVGLRKGEKEKMTREEIVVANIDRTIGRFKCRANNAEGEVEEQASNQVIRLLETTLAELWCIVEEGTSIKRNVSKVMNRAIGEFKFMEEDSSYEVEESIYEEARKCLDVNLMDYMKEKKEFPRMFVVGETIII